MRRIAGILLALALLACAVSAGAAGFVFPLTGWDMDGNETEIAVPDNCRLIILDCWQPWCTHCIRGMANLNRMYERYRDRGLLVIGVYSYTDADLYTENLTAKQIAEREGVTYPVLRVPQETIDAWAPIGYPTVWMTDRDGNTVPFTHEEKVAMISSYTRALWQLQLEEAGYKEDDPEYAAYMETYCSDEALTKDAESFIAECEAKWNEGALTGGSGSEPWPGIIERRLWIGPAQ